MSEQPWLYFPPLAASDGYGGLPPLRQVFLTPTIIVTLFVLGIAFVVIAYLSHRNRRKKLWERRDQALRLAEKMLLKRGGVADDVERLYEIFDSNPRIEPGDTLILRDKFKNILRPVIDSKYGDDYGAHLESLFFPPLNEAKVITGQATSLLRKKAVPDDENGRLINIGGQTPAGLLDLMDAALRPGVSLRMSFSGIEGGYNCLVMGYDMQGINVTLPANNDQLVASLHSGLDIEGTVENGSSLLAFTSRVVQAVAGSMPFCRIAAWIAAWEVRKRDSMRLALSLEVDFQHISTADSGSIRMSSLTNKLGAIRPGRIVDISLGGCGIETMSASLFQVGDLIRFSKSLVDGAPPATLLGSVVKIDPIDPESHDNARQRLHIQFLMLDDVSQRLLFRAIKRLQEISEKNEWLQAQQLMQKMRHNNIAILGSPTGNTGVRYSKLASENRNSTTALMKKNPAQKPPAKKSSNPNSAKPSTRSLYRPEALENKQNPSIREADKPPTRKLPPITRIRRQGE
ncbi:MAG: PilZ domain-containing protein [Planctomycetota bacterium]|jgi:c-di-GMP-binding flagellar brake protein YcgR|nr:PilZ domain-containing protein [Planctomycetota bacterium]